MYFNHFHQEKISTLEHQCRYVRKRRRYLEKDEIRRVVVPEEHRPMSRRDFVASLKQDDTVFLVPDEKSASKDPWYAKAFMKYKLRHIFADSRQIEYDFSPLPIEIPRAPLSSIEKAASFVRTAKRPVLVLGSQSVLPVERVRGVLVFERFQSFHTFMRVSIECFHFF